VLVRQVELHGIRDIASLIPGQDARAGGVEAVIRRRELVEK
jgi:hypothetical protein